MPKKTKPAEEKPIITNQTTPEELKAKIDALDEEPVIVRNPDITPPPETPPVETPPEVPPEIEKDKEEAEAEEEPETPLETSPELPKEPDWKSRYVGSTREAQVLAARNKKFAESIENANNLPEPTEEEMKKEYGENWDVMDDIQRKIAKDSVLSKKRFAVIHEVAEESKKADEWVDKAKKFVDDPQNTVKYPQLVGREAEFVQFCSLPTRVGVDLEDLVRAFSFDIKQEIPKRKTLFETGGGGQPPAPKELTVEDISFLRTHNAKEYKRLVQSGKIKIEV